MKKVGVTGSAAAALVFSFSAQAQIAALPPGTETRPVQLARVVATLSRGESIGRIRTGLMCWGRQNLTWKSGATTELNTKDLDEVFREKLQKLGYKVAGDPADLFSDSNDGGAGYLIGGSIEHLNVDVCFPMSYYENWDNTKGSASVEVKWQIYSRLERRVVATIKTDGSFEEKKSKEGVCTLFLSVPSRRACRSLPPQRNSERFSWVLPLTFQLRERLPMGSRPFD